MAIVLFYFLLYIYTSQRYNIFNQFQKYNIFVLVKRYNFRPFFLPPSPSLSTVPLFFMHLRLQPSPPPWLSSNVILFFLSPFSSNTSLHHCSIPDFSFSAFLAVFLLFLLFLHLQPHLRQEENDFKKEMRGAVVSPMPLIWKSGEGYLGEIKWRRTDVDT